MFTDLDDIGRLEGVHPASKNRVQKRGDYVAMPLRRSYCGFKRCSKLLGCFPITGIEFYCLHVHAIGRFR